MSSLTKYIEDRVSKAEEMEEWMGTLEEALQNAQEAIGELRGCGVSDEMLRDFINDGGYFDQILAPLEAPAVVEDKQVICTGFAGPERDPFTPFDKIGGPGCCNPFDRFENPTFETPLDELPNPTQDEGWRKDATFDSYLFGHLIEMSECGQPPKPDFERLERLYKSGNLCIKSDGDKKKVWKNPTDNMTEKQLARIISLETAMGFNESWAHCRQDSLSKWEASSYIDQLTGLARQTYLLMREETTGVLD